jgi:hypothetical protein
MPDWMKPEEATSYFGIDLAALQALVLEYDMDVEVDDEGNITALNAADCREALFPEYEKVHGHRPDDPHAREKAEKDQEDKEKKEKAERDARKQQLL